MLAAYDEDQDPTAREDARGAIVGAGALTLFAALAAVTFGHPAAGVVLAIAAVAWAGAAVLGYVVFWWR